MNHTKQWSGYERNLIRVWVLNVVLQMQLASKSGARHQRALNYYQLLWQGMAQQGPEKNFEESLWVGIAVLNDRIPNTSSPVTPCSFWHCRRFLRQYEATKIGLWYIYSPLTPNVTFHHEKHWEVAYTLQWVAWSTVPALPFKTVFFARKSISLHSCLPYI